jgi:hypothetical protein
MSFHHIPNYKYFEKLSMRDIDLNFVQFMVPFQSNYTANWWQNRNLFYSNRQFINLCLDHASYLKSKGYNFCLTLLCINRQNRLQLGCGQELLLILQELTWYSDLLCKSMWLVRHRSRHSLPTSSTFLKKWDFSC